MELREEIIEIARRAKEATYRLGIIPTVKKNKVLRDMARILIEKKSHILKENRKDVRKAEKKSLPKAFIDRLTLNEKRLFEMAESLKQIERLSDPVGKLINSWRAPSGFLIRKVRVPIGVIGIIYESRPNVTSDCIGLCLKSSNSLILRGGSEAINSNIAIFDVLGGVCDYYQLPQGSINIIRTTDRKAVDILLKLSEYVDLIIPRGGESLVNLVTRKSQIPVIKHYKGVCHVYVDRFCDLRMAEEVCFNAKTQRPATCNAAESMLVHKEIAKKFLPIMIKRFIESNVEIRGCIQTLKILEESNIKSDLIKRVKTKDFKTEYLDLILSVKVVEDLGSAIDHINRYGTHHSDSIITKDPKVRERFLKEVDSACVYCNASTRLTDGFQFGMGSEMGISTDKIHARGPMALEELTSYKYKIYGSGHIRR